MYLQNPLQNAQSRKSSTVQLESHRPAPNSTTHSLQCGLTDPPECIGRPSIGSQPDDSIAAEYVDEPTTAQAQKSILAGIDDDVNAPLHVAQFLQYASRRALLDQAISQSSVFRSIAPLVIFLWILGVASFLPRNYSGLERKYGADTLHTRLIIGILGGLGMLLLALRGGIWVTSVFVKSFCNADLLGLFRKGELVDSEGIHMGDADMVLGNFFR